MATDYGHDLSLLTDLDPSMLEVDGLRCLAEACARRLQTPRGGLIDDPNYGFDVTGLLNDDLDTRAIAQLGAGVDGELVKDERIVRTTTAVSFVRGALMLDIKGLASNGPFRLVLAASDVTVSILKAA